MNKHLKEALKMIEENFKSLDKIKSNYSSEELKINLDRNYHFLIFTNFIQNTWVLNSGGEIYNFLDFYGLKITNKDKLNFFYHRFGYYLDFFEVIGNNIITKYEIKDFFENEIYLKLDETDLENVTIVPSKKLNKEEFWEYFYKGYMEDFFASVYYGYYDTYRIGNDKIYNDEKKIIINTLSYLYSVLGDEFEINQQMFNKKQEISFMDFIISYTYVGFIKITEISIAYEENITYGIKILSEFKKILDEIEEKRNLILDKIFDEKYKQITIKKKNGEINLLEGDLEIIGDDTKFIELKKQYPFSKIETEIHNGKTSKFIIKEKIKLKKDDK